MDPCFTGPLTMSAAGAETSEARAASSDSPEGHGPASATVAPASDGPRQTCCGLPGPPQLSVLYPPQLIVAAAAKGAAWAAIRRSRRAKTNGKEVFMAAG